jgi:8-oxo-dGTP pyrophosphatase MutT (NUDIX family)
MRGGRWIEENLYSQIRQLLPIACVDILAVHNGRLLLLLRNFEPAKDFWFTPGGRINYGETLEQAALRELREETGLAATRLEKKGVMSHFYPTSHCVTIFFRAEVRCDQVKLNQEHRDYKWICESDDTIHPYVRQMIIEAGIFSIGSAMRANQDAGQYFSFKSEGTTGQ